MDVAPNARHAMGSKRTNAWVAKVWSIKDTYSPTIHASVQLKNFTTMGFLCCVRIVTILVWHAPQVHLQLALHVMLLIIVGMMVQTPVPAWQLILTPLGLRVPNVIILVRIVQVLPKINVFHVSLLPIEKYRAHNACAKQDSTQFLVSWTALIVCIHAKHAAKAPQTVHLVKLFIIDNWMTIIVNVWKSITMISQLRHVSHAIRHASDVMGLQSRIVLNVKMPSFGHWMPAWGVASVSLVTLTKMINAIHVTSPV